MRRGDGGFTLIELLAVIAIIAMLVAMAVPHMGRIQERTQSIVCMNNLRQIGIGVLSYAGEHDNTFPVIEPNPESPVYLPEDEATPLYVELEPYGVTQQVLRCPADIRGPNYFAQRTTVIDGSRMARAINGGRSSMRKIPSRPKSTEAAGERGSGSSSPRG